MSTSTATAYKYSVAGHLSFCAPKCEKAQKSSGFWANRTYRLCIKDNVLIDFACGTGGFLTSWLKELGQKVTTTEEQEAFNNSIYGIEKKQFPYMLCITNMLLHDIDVPQVYHNNSLLKDVLDYTEDDQFDVILYIIWSSVADKSKGVKVPVGPRRATLTPLSLSA